MAMVDLGIPALTPKGSSAEPGSTPRPDDPGLIDRWNRRATDLRVSLTDRCNLRCTYCMPEAGLRWLPRRDQLTDAEIIRLITIAVRDLGVTEVRFTGGEPLLRPGLVDIIAATSRLTPETALTTNAIGLAGQASRLVAAGLARINVSLDTVDRETFHALTRRDRLPEVLAGLAAAAQAGLTPVKVNAVLLRGYNDDQAPDLLGFCLEHGYELRFIEQMPLDAQHGWRREQMITAAEILASLRGRFTLTPDPRERGTAPAERWLVNGGPATVGVIASVTRPFCAACDRTRLTADGAVRSCLFSHLETDLRTPLRDGRDDAEIAALWRSAMWAKGPGHGIDGRDFDQPARPMSAIGG